MMKRWFPVVAVAAVALILADVGTSHAQRFRRGGGYGSNWGGWGWGANSGYYSPGYYGYNYGFSPYGMGVSPSIGTGYTVSGYMPNTYAFGTYGSWPSTYGYNTMNYGVSPNTYGNAVTYGTPMYSGNTAYSPSSYAMTPQSYVSFYPPNFPQGSPMVGSTTNPNTVGSTTNPNQATIEVRCPPDAQVFFDGEATQQRGTDRLFTSPPLEPGKRYHYDVKATWREGDTKREKTRTVQVEPGKHVTVDFTSTGSDRDMDRDRDRTGDLDRGTDRTRDRDQDRTTPDRNRGRTTDKNRDKDQ